MVAKVGIRLFPEAFALKILKMISLLFLILKMTHCAMLNIHLRIPNISKNENFSRKILLKYAINYSFQD